jgi:LPXTG-motif cell wall-anchored protein
VVNTTQETAPPTTVASATTTTPTITTTTQPSRAGAVPTDDFFVTSTPQSLPVTGTGAVWGLTFGGSIMVLLGLVLCRRSMV